ncbi:hypothetical protein [Litchfieldella xinjiangensis]|uniref:hypothetical protein n=1 Tax=Litchfieldella xinjiangensis TaxID=1166948 RepID=UPI0012E0AAF9|nr:hypothetical protein [Halomonas xinjiangensis]
MKILYCCLLFSGLWGSLAIAEGLPGEDQTIHYIDQMLYKYGSCRYLDQSSGRKSERFLTGFDLEDGKVTIRSQYEDDYVIYDGNTLHKRHFESSVIEIENLSSVELEGAVNEIGEDAQGCKTWLILKCEASEDCIDIQYKDESYYDSRVNDEGHITASITVLSLKSDLEKSQKITRAMQHLWELHNLNLVDATLNEELF